MRSTFFCGEPDSGLEYVLQRFYSSIRIHNESGLHRDIPEENGGEKLFALVDGAFKCAEIFQKVLGTHKLKTL